MRCDRAGCDGVPEIVVMWVTASETHRHHTATMDGSTASVGWSVMRACRSCAREAWAILGRNGMTRRYRQLQR